MANLKISQLTDIAAAQDVADLLAIVDDSATETKKVSLSNFFAKIVSGGDIVMTPNAEADGVLIAQSGSPDASARLQIDSTVGGLLPPRLTTTQRDNISTPAAGLTIYNSTDNELQTYNGSSWVSGGGGGGAPTDATYITQTANGTLTNEQALSALATGIVKNTTGTGVLSIAVAGTDYAAASHTHVEADITDLQSYLLDITGENLSSLADVTITGIGAGELLKWNGAAWINNTLAEAGVAAASHTHVEADITDLQSYLLDITGENLSSLADVTITGIGAGELLKWDGAAWINNTLAEAGIAAASHTHNASDINAGTLLHERGGLEADVSAYGGVALISGGSTSELKYNLAASTDPGATDDSGSGYAVGSRWINTTLDKEFVCLDATVSAAVWTETTGAGGGGAPTDATYITQTANGTLTNEQALASLSTGIMKSTTGTGVVSIAVEGTDYYGPSGTDVAVADGGTGASTAQAGFNALSPVTTLGDIIYRDASNNVRLAGNITTAKQFLSQTGTGAASAAPAWATLVEADISDLQSYLLDITGENLSSLADVTITGIGAGELLKWDGAAWINNTLAEAGIAAASHTHNASDINAGTLLHERGGLEADVSAYGGVALISGGSTSELKYNLAASTDPGATDDSGSGYAVGSRWINTTGDREFVCLDATVSSAVWTETTVTAGGAPSDATYITQTANGTLTNEQALASLSTGIMKSTTGTGVVSIAVEGTDYYGPGGTDVAVADGGTGASTAQAGFNALSPVTTLGDIIYRDASNNVRLAGNITTTKQFLSQTGTGAASAAPAWATLTEADISDLQSYLLDITGENLSSLADVTITGIGAGELLKWDGAAWINNTLAEAGIAAASHTHNASDIDAGTLLHERGGLEADVSAYDGILKISGGTTSAVTAPTGDLVGTTDTQTLTNKTIIDLSNEVAADFVRFQVFNNTGGTLTKGTPVYISGYNVGQDLAEIDQADADNSAAMPAIGVVEADISTGNSGSVIGTGRIYNLDTSSYSVGDELWVSTTAGTLTATKPSAATVDVQKMAQVLRSHLTLGVLEIFGAGRSNDIPNKQTTDRFRIADNTDDTKLAVFDLTAITTATTRTITLGDRNLNLASGGTFAEASHTHAAGDVTSGSFPVARGGTGLSTVAADNLIYTSALDTFAATAISAFGRSLIDDADSGTARTTLGAAATSHTHNASDINAGTLLHERGGLEADVSAYGGVALISGGSTSELKYNLAASVAPGSTDDSGSGYAVGSRWIDTTADKEYVCLDATVSAAVWTETTGGGGGGAPTDATYITQTTNATLTNEQALASLGTGLMKNTTGTGVISIAVDGTDYIAEVSSDTTPQLGGNLDVNGNSITSTTSVPITTGSSAGHDLTVNTTTLVVEGDNARVGIGTAAPDEVLHVNGNIKYDGQGWSPTDTLTDGASIATNCNNGNVFTVTLAGNRTLSNPTNLQNGATYIWIIKQDGTGSRTLAYGSAFKFAGSPTTTPELSTAANAVDLLSGVSDGTNVYVNLIHNFG